MKVVESVAPTASVAIGHPLTVIRGSVTVTFVRSIFQVFTTLKV